MQATAKKATQIPANRIHDVLQYLNLVSEEEAEEVLNMIAERLKKKRQPTVQLTLIKNETVETSKSTGKLEAVSEKDQKIKEVKAELTQSRYASFLAWEELAKVQKNERELKAELAKAQEKLEQMQTLIALFKSQSHPTSPRWEQARKLLTKLDLINDGKWIKAYQ